MYQIWSDVVPGHSVAAAFPQSQAETGKCGDTGDMGTQEDRPSSSPMAQALTLPDNKHEHLRQKASKGCITD